MSKSNNKKLIIFSGNADDKKVISSFLFSFLGHYIDIECMNEDDPLPDIPPPVVLSTETAIDRARQLFPNSKVIFVSRTISNTGIEDLIMLPPSSTVLVVNKPRSAALETIQGLKEFGINHLNYIPYWPGFKGDMPDIEIVVYPGFRNYCPKGYKKYINIGYRDIKFSVISEIIKIYDLPPQILDKIQQKYNKRNMKTAYKIKSHLEMAEQLKNNFQKILSIGKNIFINTDTEYNIINLNKSAEEFFSVNYDQVVSAKFTDTFAKYTQLIMLYEQNEEVEDVILSLNDSSVVVSIIKFKSDNMNNRLVSIIPTEFIQKTDAKIRSALRESGFNAKYTFRNILGRSNVIAQTVALARQYAKSDAPLLIFGESGTGKELFAQSIHNASARNKFPFVSINCAALPENLIESELFGYDEGAFTGAVKGGRAGKFELAHKGTIFLDEVGDASLSIQAKLLRVIEEHEIVRIGANKLLPIDVRIICATNKNLIEMVKTGEFRDDLYYRIRVLALYIPSLRERKSDIQVISDFLFRKYGINDEKLISFLTDKLYSYSWPGNIRELRSAVQLISTLYVTSEKKVLDKHYLENVLERHYLSNEKNAVSEEDVLEQLLRVIGKKSEINISFGRGTLIKAPELAHLSLTEHTIRRYISELSKRKFIRIGATKQGIRITDEGKAYLAKSDNPYA